MERTFDLHQQNKSISKRPKLIAALKKGDKTVAELAEIGEVSTGRIREYFYGGAIVIKDGLGSLSKKFKLVTDLGPKTDKKKAGTAHPDKSRSTKTSPKNRPSQKSKKEPSGKPSKDKTTKKVDLKK